MQRNLPSGWAAFRELRQTPLPIEPRRHGNYKHGDRSKEGIASAREFRAIVWIVKHPFAAGRLPADFVSSRPQGWAAFRERRDRRRSL